ncbi:uncharacterized protein LOC131952884 [Physella acuta]|uniref:uncharacterized protein LOC131952884 n=1 Tax=Physella acuta TaxID=109671 RepID=UPI0027DDBC2C|nr:uncharacterized protein LOC131952884 [Physella acuta]
MSYTLLIVVLAITAFAHSADADRCKWDNSEIYNQKCYTATDTLVWSDNLGYCETYGYPPISIRNKEDLVYFKNKVLPTESASVWVGATDILKEGIFIWEDTKQPVSADFEQLFDRSTNTADKDCLLATAEFDKIIAVECDETYAVGYCVGHLIHEYTTQSTTQDTSMCPSREYSIYNEKCFIIGVNNGSWVQTKQACANYRLPTMGRPFEEFMTLVATIKNIDGKDFWVGANDSASEGKFIMEDTLEPLPRRYESNFLRNTNTDAKDCLLFNYTLQAIVAANCETAKASGYCHGDVIPAAPTQPTTPAPAWNWNYQIQMAANITSYFAVGADEVRFAAMIFNSVPTKVFDLKDHLDHDSLAKALLALPHPTGYGSKTYIALQDITKKNMFGAEAGGRDDAPNNVIVVTDGGSDNREKTLGEAVKLKQANTTIIAVGVGPKPSQE